ncbi:MAG TPA: cellulase family glycosylhydrolase [Gemmatimonadaceae bacterium]|nr:cellulase family glycosylhydrolase [Gemmatimonadaceae bacterium]
MSFELGLNYWPRRSAMYMWEEFDIGEVREDMTHIADMGFDVVRIFARTKDFLTAATTVDAIMIGRLVEVVRAAGDAGLLVVPTLIVLNMSGTIWWPDWMLDAQGNAADVFSDPVVVRAQALLAQTCALALAANAAIRGFDLANEIDDAQLPKSREAGSAWASTLANAIRGVSPNAEIRIGAHLPSLTTDNNMRVDDLASVLDADVMHAYPLYSDFARSFLDPELVPFSCALTAGLAGAGRRTLMQEFGMCTASPGTAGRTITDDFLGTPRSQYLASEGEQSSYYETVLERLLETGAAGAYAWCYGDYDDRLFSRPPLATAVRERTFGIVRTDGSEKPAADVFRRFSERRLEGPFVHGEVPRVLDVSPDEYYRDPARHFGRLYSTWVAERAS